MNEILEQLEGLRQLSGNAQIDYLESVKNPRLKEILEYCYDTHRKYKIDEGKYDKVSTRSLLMKEVNKPVITEQDWYKFKTILDNLSEIKSANDLVVASVKDFIESFDQEEHSKFFKMVLFKDLRLNMNTKKFQKVWPDFLVEPQVQLAKAIEDRQVFTNPRYSRKFDGKRTWFTDFIPMSRTNKACSTKPIQHIIDQLKNSGIDLNNYILDGELLYFENGREDFQKGISLCQRDERLPGCENLCYVIFDMVDKDHFYQKEPWIPFKEEYTKILDMFQSDGYTPCYSLIPTVCPNVFIARQDENNDKLMPLCIQNGWEGTMCRNADSPYEYKRTTNLLKIKEMHDMELQLMDMEEGTGKHEGRLGAFWVDYNGYRVQVGSGFTDEQREEYWNNKDKYIGQFVKVQYFEETINQQGEKSLRFPVFKSFRDLNSMEEFLY